MAMLNFIVHLLSYIFMSLTNVPRMPYTIPALVFFATQSEAMKANPESSVPSRSKQPPRNPSEEIFFQSKGFGTLVWIFPDELSREFQGLPPRVKKERKHAAEERLKYVGMLVLGLLKHPELEKAFGIHLDRNLGELADLLTSFVEHASKPQ